MSSLPEEIYLEILLRLPAKSTFACKCVCKTWFRLISDPYFVNLHLDHATKINKRSLVFASSEYSFPFYSISCESLSTKGFDADAHDVVRMYFPVKYDDTLLCSCNGLLLFWGFQDKFFYLCNPVTKEHKVIPRSLTQPPDYYIFAFGYDCMTDDYKLVSIVSERVDYERDGEDSKGETDYSCTVQVYTLRTNSWKNLQPIPCKFDCEKECGALLNGAFHWSGETQGQQVIISLDIGDERFKHIQIPDKVVEVDREYYRNVEVLQRCLCLFVNYDGKSELWVMQDYGVCESWTKHYIINHENITTSAWICVRVILSFKNGDILLKIDDDDDEEEIYDLVIHDPKQGSVKETKIHGLEVRSHVENHIESLVSLGTGINLSCMRAL